MVLDYVVTWVWSSIDALGFRLGLLFIHVVLAILCTCQAYGVRFGFYLNCTRVYNLSS